MPQFPLPLAADEVEPIIELQGLLNQVYDRAGYNLVIDDGQPPMPPGPVNCCIREFNACRAGILPAWVSRGGYPTRLNFHSLAAKNLKCDLDPQDSWGDDDRQRSAVVSFADAEEVVVRSPPTPVYSSP